MQNLLRPIDVAERLSVSRAWVYDAAKVGRIPAIRIGGKDGPLRFVADDLERWIDEARAAWTPGRGTVATSRARGGPHQPRARGSRRPRSSAAGQQTLM